MKFVLLLLTSFFLFKEDTHTEITCIENKNATVFIKFKKENFCYFMDTSYIRYDNKVYYLYNENLISFRDYHSRICNFDSLFNDIMISKGYSINQSYYIEDSTLIGFRFPKNKFLWDFEKIIQSKKMYHQSKDKYIGKPAGTIMKDVTPIYYYGGSKYKSQTDSTYVISFNIKADLFLIESNCKTLEDYKSMRRSKLVYEPILVDSPFIIVGKCYQISALDSVQIQEYKILPVEDSLRMCYSYYFGKY